MKLVIFALIVTGFIAACMPTACSGLVNYKENKAVKWLQARNDFMDDIWTPYSQLFERCLRKARLAENLSPRSPVVQWRRLEFLKYTLPASLQDFADLQLKKDLEYAAYWLTGKLSFHYQRMSFLNKVLKPCMEENWNESFGDPVWKSHIAKRIKDGLYEE